MVVSAFEKVFNTQPDDRTRAAGIDPYLSSAFFLLISLASGRVWRYPFDDETYSLDIIHDFHLGGILSSFFAYDFHPPLSYAIFALLDQVLPEWGLHAFSLVLCAIAIWVIHKIVINSSREWSLADRLFAFIAFGIIPLCLQLGDAIRWYPPYVLITSLAVIHYYYRPNDPLGIAILLGLMSLLSYAGYFVIVGFLFFRYASERVRVSADGKFITIIFLGQLPSLIYLCGSLFWKGELPSQMSQRLAAQGVLHPDLRGLFDLVVGLVGGHSIGLGNVWTILPLVIVYVVMLMTFLRAFRENDRIENLALCLIIGALPFAASGHSKAYSFFQVAVMLPVLLVRYFQKLRGQSSKMWLMAILCLANVSAVANMQYSFHPFRRVYPAPYDEIVAAVDRNFIPQSVLLTSDENIISYLGPNVDCVFFLDQPVRGRSLCPTIKADGGERPTGAAKVLILDGHRSWIDFFEASKHLSWSQLQTEFIGKRREIASMPYGTDADASMKSRLSGMLLSRFVFVLHIYE